MVMFVPLEAISLQMLISNGRLEAGSFKYAQFPHTLSFGFRESRDMATHIEAIFGEPSAPSLHFGSTDF